MLIDLIFFLFIIIGVVKGLQRGFIVAIFSIIAIIIGIAAAMKLSTVAAGYLKDSVDISSRWLPVISFIVVFLIVVVLVRLGANILHKTVEIVFLGWLNRLLGAVLYFLLYIVVFSVLLFFAEQSGIIKQQTITNSKIYPWVEPIGPYVINGVGNIIPFFRDMFNELKEFFSDMSKQTSTTL